MNSYSSVDGPSPAFVNENTFTTVDSSPNGRTFTYTVTVSYVKLKSPPGFSWRPPTSSDMMVDTRSRTSLILAGIATSSLTVAHLRCAYEINAAHPHHLPRPT